MVYLGTDEDEYDYTPLADDEEEAEPAPKAGLPASINEIERAILLDWPLEAGDWQSAPEDEFLAFLVSKGIDGIDGMPADELREKIYLHLRTTSQVIDDIARDGRKDGERLVKSLMGRPAMQRVAAVDPSYRLGICSAAKAIKKLDELIEAGGTYMQAVQRFIHCDDQWENLALVAHIEEKNGVEIKTPEQLKELAGLEEWSDGEDGESVDQADPDAELEDEEDERLPEGETKRIFEEVQDLRYTTRLEELLRNGGKYADLIGVEPSEYGLPEAWAEDFSKTKSSTIEYVVYSAYFSKGDRFIRPVSVRDVAKRLEAPYSVVLRASDYSDRIFR